MPALILPSIPRDRAICSASLHSRTMNKIGVVRPSCRAVLRGSGGVPAGQQAKGGSGCALLRRPPRPVSLTHEKDNGFSSTC